MGGERETERERGKEREGGKRGVGGERETERERERKGGTDGRGKNRKSVFDVYAYMFRYVWVHFAEMTRLRV